MAPSLHQIRKWIVPLIKTELFSIILFVLLEVLALIAGLTFVYASKKAIDLALSADSTAMYWALSQVVASIFMVFLFRTWSSWVNQRAKSRMLMSLQNKMVHIQTNAVWKVSQKRQAGDIQLRIYDDASEVVNMIVSNGPQVFLTTLSLFAALGFMWIMDTRLTLIIVGMSPLFLLSKFYYKRLRKLNAEIKEQQGVLSNIIQENLKYRILVRAMALSPQRQELINYKQKEIYTLKNKLLTLSLSSQSIVRLFVQVGFLVTFCWGVYHLHRGLITFGTMTAFLQLVSRIQSPLVQLMSFLPTYIRFRTATDRVDELLQEEVEDEVQPISLPDIQAVELKNVYFRYEDRYVIENLNLFLKKGESVAILGNSGKGKTTLTRLLLALLEPESGEIVLHTSKNQLSLNKAHRINIAYVPQGEKIFRGTVRENLTMAQSNTDDQHLTEVISLSCAEFVYDLPKGLETSITESGMGLSEGQIHRIALARSLMRPSPIWLFDELTAALDRQTADQLMNRLLAASTDKILFFVTHDAKLAAQCTYQIYL